MGHWISPSEIAIYWWCPLKLPLWEVPDREMEETLHIFEQYPMSSLGVQVSTIHLGVSFRRSLGSFSKPVTPYWEQTRNLREACLVSPSRKLKPKDTCDAPWRNPLLAPRKEPRLQIIRFVGIYMGVINLRFCGAKWIS